ncbi:unnamed protein product [Rotaria sp. Silwood2]|nr:unnamed protein product [Rotaria sp. Silwood2]
MSGSIDALLPSCATESTVGMGKVENKEAPSLDEGPKGSANADNLTQKASANNNNIGEQATAAIHGCQNSAITVPATLSDAAENQLIETGNNPLEQNRKASDMQDSPDASKTLTGVQNISTNQLATGNDPNGMQSLNISTNQLATGNDPNGMQGLVNVPTTLARVQDMDVDQREENEKASGIQNSSDASKTLTGVQNISTNQLATDNDPNGMQGLVNVPTVSTTVQNMDVDQRPYSVL